MEPISMKKVMGAVVNTNQPKDTSGGKIMTTGHYDRSAKSGDSKDVAYTFGHKYQKEDRGAE